MPLPTRWPEARAKPGVVASPHRLASGAGLALLHRGGTARTAMVILVEDWSDLMVHAQVIRLNANALGW